MLLLDSTSDIVRLTTDAAGDIEVHASYMDNNSGTVTPASDNIASITTATTTTIVAAPGASVQRNVKHLNIYNNHASQAVLCTVDHQDGTDTSVLFEVTLLAGESLVFNQSGVWLHYDVNGGIYPQVGAQASQAEMEAGTSVVTTVSPGRLHFHPAAAKFWVLAGVTANVLASYNVTSLTDTAGGAIGVTIATDFSSANWACQVSVQRVNTTAAESNQKCASVRSTARAAGTVECDCWDATATTQVQEDPTQWNIMGYGDL